MSATRGTANLAASHDYCRQLARRSASSFYWSFWLLPRDKRRAMCALYAFARHTDDLGDSDEPAAARRRALDDWRTSLDAALRGTPAGTLWPALRHTVERYGIPPEHLYDVIDGVVTDLEPFRYETFAELERYCQLVASAVGLACVRIWGYRDARALALAKTCGVAMQLTNILRDLGEDLARDRLYLPREDLRRFGYAVEDLRAGRVNDAYHALLRFEIDRAEQLFAASQPLLACLRADGRRACAMMRETYRGLLAEIQRRRAEVLRRRVHLPWRRKFPIVVRALWL